MLMALSCVYTVLQEQIPAYNAKYPFPLNYNMLYGVVIYFHLKSIIYPNFTFQKKHLLHIIPSLCINVITFIGLFTYIRHHLDWAYAHVDQVRLVIFSTDVIAFCHMTVYTLMSIRLIKSSTLINTDYTKQISAWLQLFKRAWFIFLLCIGSFMVLAPLSWEQFVLTYKVHYLLLTCIVLSIYGLGYQYLLKFQPLVHKYLERAQFIQKSLENIASKKERLCYLLEQEEVYKNKDLDVKRLAQYLNCTQKEVPLIIRESFDSNFTDLINSYRIKAFKSLIILPENQKFSIAGLAEEVGFNSKASFYRVFKKTSGQTPKEYLAQYQR